MSWRVAVKGTPSRLNELSTLLTMNKLYSAFPAERPLKEDKPLAGLIETVHVVASHANDVLAAWRARGLSTTNVDAQPLSVTTTLEKLAVLLTVSCPVANIGQTPPSDGGVVNMVPLIAMLGAEGGAEGVEGVAASHVPTRKSTPKSGRAGPGGSGILACARLTTTTDTVYALLNSSVLSNSEIEAFEASRCCARWRAAAESRRWLRAMYSAVTLVSLTRRTVSALPYAALTFSVVGLMS